MYDFTLPTVALTKADYTDPDRLKESVADALSNVGGIQNFVRSGQRVLLKPDLITDYPAGAGLISHPEFVAAVGRLAADQGATVLIGDSPFITGANVRRLWDDTGVTAVAERDGFELVNIERAGSRPVAVDTKVYYISRVALEADVVINLPRLKGDSWTGFSGALRNMLGVVPGFQKGLLFARATNARSLARTIVDVFSTVKPSLTIMEMTPPNGAMSGVCCDANFMAVSPDPVAVDCVMAELLSCDPSRMLSTRYAAEAGLGIGWLEAIRLAGESFESVQTVVANKVQFRSNGIWPRVLLALVEPLTWVRSYVDNKTCDGCGTCTEVCPTKALQFSNGSQIPTINYNLCIGCWAGLTNCPKEAIHLRKSRLSDRVFSS